MKKVKILSLMFICLCAFCFAFGIGLNTVKADVTVAEVDDTNFYMLEGASVKTAESYDDTGIRFTLKMNKEIHDGIKANTDYSNVHFGIFIAPKHYNDGNPVRTTLTSKYKWRVNGEGEYVNDGEGRREIINLATSEMMGSSSELTFYGSVVKMKTDNLLREYVGVGYMYYEDGGGSHYKFAADNDNSRSMVYVAQKAIEYGKDENGNLQKYYLTDAIKATPANYIVEYYLQNNEGAYVKDETLSETVNATEVYGLTIGDEVAMDLKNIDGYRYVYNAAEKTEGNVYANDKLVLKAYYNNESVTQDVFTFTYPGDISVVTVGEGDGCGTGHLANLNSVVANLYGTTNTADTAYNITFPKVDYSRYGSVNFTMTSNVGKGTTTVSIDETLIHTGFTKNVAVNVKTVTSGDKVLVFVNDVRKTILSDDVANGTESLVLRVWRQGTGTNDALVFSSMTGSYQKTASFSETLNFHDFTVEDVDTVTSQSGNNVRLDFTAAGTRKVTFPAYPYDLVESVSFSYSQYKGGAIYIDGNGTAIANNAMNTLEIRNGTLYLNDVQKHVLTEDELNGMSGIVIQLYGQANAVGIIYAYTVTPKNLLDREKTNCISQWTYDNFIFGGTGDNSAAYNDVTGKIDLTLSGAAGTRQVYFPKIAYSLFSSVEFIYNCNVASSIYFGVSAVNATGAAANDDITFKVEGNKLYMNDNEKYSLTADEISGKTGILLQIYKAAGTHIAQISYPVAKISACDAALNLDGTVAVALAGNEGDDYTLDMPLTDYIAYEKTEFTFTCTFNGTIAIAGTTVEVTSDDTVKIFTIRAGNTVTLYVNGIKATVLADEIADGTNALTVTVTLGENDSATSVTVSAITVIRNY